MMPVSTASADPTEAVDRADFAPPPWVRSLVDFVETEDDEAVDGLALSVADAPHATFARVRVAGAVELDALAFQRETVRAYGVLAAASRDRPASQPVRFWNQIPCIRAAMGNGMDRYMAFNAGRFVAFDDWFGTENVSHRAVATATGIGHDGDDLVIDVLAEERPGTHIQNPRQRRPFSYSRRFGPFPPCFARATVTERANGVRRVLIGGTASVLEEESVHVGDLGAQTEETFNNLASLVRASMVGAGDGAHADDDMDVLRTFESARVYYLHDHDADDVRRLVQARWPDLRDIEYLRADICRPELLIEIEGVARIPARVAGY